MTGNAAGSLAGRSVDVIGGGIGGLSAAAFLADAGADVTVLEKQPRLGGPRTCSKPMASASTLVPRGI